MITDLQMTYAAFDLWLSAEGEDNRAELERVKRILPMILEECCTVKQVEYIKLYFIEKNDDERNRAALWRKPVFSLPGHPQRPG